MFESRDLRNAREDESGLIGIGTLVIFVSIVIVSSVAASILINTSLSLQQQARATTKDTVSQISSGVKVIDAKGKTDDNQMIENIDIIVRPYPGTQGINLEDTTIQYKSKKMVSYMNWDNSVPPIDRGKFGVFGISDQSDTGKAFLSMMGDVARIRIRLHGENKLDPGGHASVSIVPSSGFKTYYELFIPPILGEDSWYIL